MSLITTEISTLDPSFHYLKPEAFLVLIRGHEPRCPDLGRQYGIYERGLHLGNDEDADIPLQIAFQQAHLYLFKQKDEWFVYNLTPSSDAFINGVPFAMNYLLDGDMLQVDHYLFEFCLANGAKADFYEEIYQSLTEDILTKAYNRNFFFNLLQWELKRFQKREENRRTHRDQQQPPPMSLLMFDIDHFKNFNSQYGQLVGDEVLKGVVKRAKEGMRSTDILARVGGEEFLVYLPDTNYSQAIEFAEKIRKKIAEEPFFIDLKKEALSVTISLGVASYSNEMDMNRFIEVANQFMIQAKIQGRNRVLGREFFIQRRED